MKRRIEELEGAARSPERRGEILGLINTLDAARIRNIDSLTRFHDALLFLCAYPPSPRILERAELILARFHERFRGAPLLDMDTSGIAGTANETRFTYGMARWLASRFPRQLEVEWGGDADPDHERLGAVLMRHIPMLREEALVDANVPYHDWLKAVRALDKDGGLAWFMRNLDPLEFESLGLWIRWTFGNSPVTRTRMRRRRRTIFYQRGPLLARRDVSLARALADPPLAIKQLSRREGEKALDMMRAAIAIRQREVYPFTYGDPSTIVSADCGRGVEILLTGIVAERRLPLRAGFAPLFLRNGVPIGYADAFGICERMEVSFNIFYAFRDAEAAFVFAMMLKLYHQLFGSTSFSIDRYQIGLGNEEAIEAGAFWFYRKLGFHSTDPDIERLARREEELGRRSSPQTLRRYARSPMIYDAPGSPQGAWDHFHIRDLAMKMPVLPDALARAKRGKSERQYLRMTARLGLRRLAAAF